MRNILRSLFILTLLLLSFSSKAQITIGTVDGGPYSPGSSIAATFTIGNTSCIRPGNIFNLFLVSPTGVETNIGAYNGFYSTFVNGLLPSTGINGPGYKLRIKSTSPVLISNDSNPFTIQGNSAVTAAVTSFPELGTTKEIFGYCPGKDEAVFNFTNLSTAGSVVTGTIKDELTGASEVNINFAAAPIQSFTASLAHYTVVIKASINGTIGTRAYLIVNNNVFNSFSTSGTNVVCLPGGYLEFGVDVSTPDRRIQNNFPGNTYQINWGDSNGVPEIFTLCDLKNGYVRHEYRASSCGNPPYSTGGDTRYNVFGINIGVVSPFCGTSGGPISTYVKVVTKPENSFASPITACTKSPVVFTNTSIAGQDPGNNTPECTENNVRYNWYVNGVQYASTVTKAENFSHTFDAPGTYIIKLESISAGACNGAPVEREICIQNPPIPAFTLTGTAPLTLCAPNTVKPINTSVIDNNCNPTVSYLWTITGGAVTYDAGSATAKEPTIRFVTPGVYKIKLSVTTASCGTLSTPEQTIIINGPPTAKLSPDIKLCSINSYDFNNTTSGPTKTEFSGSFTETDGIYTWEISGGSFDYLDGTTPNSKYPKIDFKEYKAYTIKVTHTNSCGTMSDTQLITFTVAPKVNAGTDQPICFNDNVLLSGSIDAPVLKYEWIGGTGTFSNRNILNPTYTPSLEERRAGTATLTLRATTELAMPCNVINDEVIIKINPEIKITSAATKIVCTGTELNYQPIATPLNTSFTWTASGSANARGFSASGSTFPINDVLTNIDPLSNATVTYVITPVNNGCTGNTFSLNVTITPKPVITPSLAKSPLCTGDLSGIILSSNLNDTKYTWTSIASTGITGNNSMTSATSVNTINDKLVNTGITTGTVTYTITPISSNGCTGAPVDVTVRVDPAVTKADAGANESICDENQYTLKANQGIAPAVGTGLWTVVPAQSNIRFTDATNPTTLVSGLAAGQIYTFRWTITAAGACGSNSDDVIITVNMPTIPGTITGNATVCLGSNSGSITLTGNNGAIIGWESSIDAGVTWRPANPANTTATYTYTNLTVPTRFRAVVRNGACSIGYTNVVNINVTPPTTTATAGADQILCNEPTALLDGNPVGQTGESGRWTVITGTPNVTFANPADPKTRVSGLVTGQTYVFRWTISGTSVCGPSFDEVSIISHPPLTNTIINTTPEVCYGQQITITGDTPTGGDGTNYAYLWESSADGNAWAVIPGQTAKNLTYTLRGTLTFRRTVTSSTCRTVSNVVRIIAQPPIINNTVTANQEICTGLAPAALTGSLPTGSNGQFLYQWQSSVNNGGVWTNINGAVSLNYIPGALTTTTLYRRVVSTLACSGALSSISNTVTITVKPNAKAEYTYQLDKGCLPFVIDAANIKAVLYPDRNATYTWFANNTLIGSGSTFPGYTIQNSNESIDIRLVVTSSLGCTQDEFVHTFSTNQAVTASYSQSAAQGCGPLIVNFVNTSTSLVNATFKWDFGNGTTSSQVMPGPVTFLPDPTGKDTTYTVTLTAVTVCGSNSVTSTVFVKAQPIAVFSPSKTVGCAPFKVTFSNTSPGSTNTYYYDFGDGTLLTKTDKSDVEHTYYTTVVRDFVVKMIAENECGRDESSYTIRVSPNTVLPELVVNADEKEGCAPFKVNFYNNTRGANAFRYDFGDGSTVLTRSAPEVVTHTFNTPGTYTITLLASNGCSDTTTTETITVLPQPLARFNADITLGCPGLVVQFSNTSEEGVGYLWDFGDGTTSTEFEPKHTYTGDREFYTVSLTTTNTLGCTYTATRNEYIHIVSPPTALFNVVPSTVISIPDYTFRFEDESTNNPTIWTWDFGDGTTSALKNPSHTYLDTGKYVVTLRVANQQGCFTSTFKTVTIVGVPGYLYVPNSFMPGSDYPELRVFKAKGSGIKTWRMSVFNKWGQTLWETTLLEEGQPVEGWDGMYQGILQPQGVFYWKIDVEFINGTAWKGMTYDSSAPKKTGAIHLIR